MGFIPFLKSELGATGQALPGSAEYSWVLREALLKYFARLYSFSGSRSGTCELRHFSFGFKQAFFYLFQRKTLTDVLP